MPHFQPARSGGTYEQVKNRKVKKNTPKFCTFRECLVKIWNSLHFKSNRTMLLSLLCRCSCAILSHNWIKKNQCNFVIQIYTKTHVKALHNANKKLGSRARWHSKNKSFETNSIAACLVFFFFLLCFAHSLTYSVGRGGGAPPNHHRKKHVALNGLYRSSVRAFYSNRKVQKK